MTEVIQERHPWQGREVIDAAGKKLGSVHDVYLSQADHHPVWMVVGEGHFGLRRVFVPVTGASAVAEGVRSSFRADVIAAAPRPADDGVLTPDEEAALLRHYGFAPQVVAHGDDDGLAAHDLRHVEGDGSMIRSEEELVVATAPRPAERVRLVKHVVVEHQEITVPVLREELRVERFPASGPGDVSGGVPIGWSADAPHALVAETTSEIGEIVLYAEEVVVTKRVVPKERVRLATDVVTDARTVRDTVRREVVDVDGDVVR